MIITPSRRAVLDFESRFLFPCLMIVKAFGEGPLEMKSKSFIVKNRFDAKKILCPLNQKSQELGITLHNSSMFDADRSSCCSHVCDRSFHLFWHSNKIDCYVWIYRMRVMTTWQRCQRNQGNEHHFWKLTRHSWGWKKYFWKSIHVWAAGSYFLI